MSFAKLTLGHQWGADEWPEYVEVDHNGGMGDGPRRYVPESTCRVVATDENLYGCECSECGQPDIDGWNYCPGCGARVVSE